MCGWRLAAAVMPLMVMTVSACNGGKSNNPATLAATPPAMSAPANAPAVPPVANVTSPVPAVAGRQTPFPAVGSQQSLTPPPAVRVVSPTTAPPGLAAGSPASPSPPPSDGSPLKVGVDLELSGAGAAQGEVYRRAIQLQADSVNAAGGSNGHPVTLIFRDNKSDPAESARVARGLIEQDGVTVLIGGGTSATSLMLTDEVETAGVPIVSLGSADAIVSPPPRRQFEFKVRPGLSDVLEVVAKDMAARGVKAAAAITLNDVAADSAFIAFQTAIAASGVRAAGLEKIAGEAGDVSAAVSATAGRAPDAILIVAPVATAARAAQALRGLGWQKPVYVVPTGDVDPAADDLSGLEGALLVEPTAVLHASDDPRSVQAVFPIVSGYTDRYGKYDVAAGYAADALGLIAAAAGRAGTDRAALRRALDTIDYQGITTNYQMSPVDHTGRSPSSLRIVLVRGSAFVTP